MAPEKDTMNKVLFLVGELKGSVDGLKTAQESMKKDLQAVNAAQWLKLESIERTLTNHRIKVLGAAAVVSGTVISVIEFFKKYI